MRSPHSEPISVVALAALAVAARQNIPHRNSATTGGTA